MKQSFSKFRFVSLSIILLTLFMFFCGQKPDDDLFNYAQAHKQELRFGTYITVGAVNAHLSDENGRREALSIIKSLGITKVFIETYRGGTVADESLLKTVRDFFKQNKIDGVGGIATVPGKDFGVRQEGQLGWFNFQAPETQQNLEKVVRLTARVFDEMIIDDFLCSADTSDLSKKAKRGRSWSQYRMDLMTDLSENLFIKTARQEKSDITIIIKYPQWYDRFHMFGYDVVREPKLYDKVWVGTETRGPATQRMGFVQQYEGFVNLRWLNSCSEGKVAGAWFDHIDCDEYDFINQAYQTILAGAKEIVLFNYFDLMNGHRGHHFLRRQFSKLVQLAAMVQQNSVKGIYGYKPPYSDPVNDFYIFDSFGMIGLPLIPTSVYPTEAEVIFLPTQAATDQDIINKVQQSITSGKTIILTPGFLNALSSAPQMLEFAGIKSIENLPAEQKNELIWKHKKISFDEDFKLAANLKVSSADVLLLVENEKKWLPFLTKNNHDSGGKVFVLNVNTFEEKDFKAINEVLLAPKPIAWLKLPQGWLNLIRSSFLEPLGLTFDGQGRISFHLFENNNIVLCNFNDEKVKVNLNIKDNLLGTDQNFLINKLTGDTLRAKNGKFKMSINKREFHWLGN